MNFIDSAKSGFVNFINFSGRSTRSEFIFWILFQILVGIVLGVVGALTNTVNLLSGLVVFVFFLPTLSLTVRRLHDIGKSGWWLFGLYIGAPVLMVFSMLLKSVFLFQALSVIFLVAYIVFMGMLLLKGSDDDNRYGPIPF